MDTFINKIMNKQAMITFLGVFLVILGIFFSSLLILLLPFLLILIGILKLYELNEKQ